MSKNVVSFSQANTHRQCPQRYKYNYIDRLEKVDPADIAVERDFGMWWHAIRAANSLDRGARKGSLKAVPKKLEGADGVVIELPTLDYLLEAADEDIDTSERKTIVSKVYAALTEWESNLPQITKDTWVERLGSLPLERLKYVDREWRMRWVAELEHEAPLAVEFGWGRELPDLVDKETGAITSPETRTVGYIDELYLDTRRNLVVARDHKAHKSLGNRRMVDDMMDSQLQLYAWGASPKVTEWGHGGIRATAYDRVRMVAPKTPALTKAGKLGKTVTDYDVTTYKKWAAGEDGTGIEYPGLKKDGSGAGKYVAEDAVIEGLEHITKKMNWQTRTLSPLNRNIVKTHLRSTVDSAMDIELTKRRVRRDGSAARNLSSNVCAWCPFMQLCRAEMIGGPGGVYDLESMYLRKKPESKR